MTPQKSPIVEALEKRRRKVHTFPASFIGDGSSNGTVAIRVPTIGEELAARIQAPKWLAEHGAIDFDAETDVESMHVVCSAWREASDPENGIACPLPEMLRARLSTRTDDQPRPTRARGPRRDGVSQACRVHG